MKYTAKYSNQDGQFRELPFTIDAKDDAEAKDRARKEAERLTRNGTITWELRAVSGRRVR